MSLLKNTPARVAPTPGDIFTFRLKDSPLTFRFGRIIDIGTKTGGFQDVVLIYIYRNTSEDKHTIPPLSKSALLIPPLGINSLPWRKKLFEIIVHQEINRDEVFSRHVFWSPSRNIHLDEYGEPIEPHGQPIGFFGLHSYLTFTGEVEKALNKNNNEPNPAP